MWLARVDHFMAPMTVVYESREDELKAVDRINDMVLKHTDQTAYIIVALTK